MNIGRFYDNSGTMRSKPASAERTLPRIALERDRLIPRKIAKSPTSKEDAGDNLDFITNTVLDKLIVSIACFLLMQLLSHVPSACALDRFFGSSNGSPPRVSSRIVGSQETVALSIPSYDFRRIELNLSNRLLSDLTVANPILRQTGNNPGNELCLLPEMDMAEALGGEIILSRGDSSLTE